MEQEIPPHRLLFDYMASHLYVASRSELLALGLNRTRIESWIRQHRLVRLLRGVYSYGRDVETREAAWRAALLVAGPAAVLAGRSALEAWGAIQPLTVLPRKIVVATELDRGAEHQGLSPALSGTKVKVVRRKFEPGDKLRTGHIQLVRPSLALVDLAREASAREVRFAFLELCRIKKFGRADVPFTFHRVAGKPGVGSVRPLLALWVPELNRIKSVFEGTVLLDWLDRGHEPPLVNWKVLGWEVDLYFEEAGFVLELDGDAFHSDPMSRRQDVVKTRDLEQKGLSVLRLTWAQYMRDPQGWIDRIEGRVGPG